MLYLKDFTFRYLALLIIVFFAYTFAGKLGLSLAFINASSTAIWPPTGIAIAVLILFGRKVWPSIFLGAFLVNVTTQGNIATSIGIALGNTLEALVAAYLVNRFAHGKNAFDHAVDVSKFTGSVLFAAMVSATIGVTTLIFGGYASLSNFWQVWFTWIFGDVGGALIIAPFIIIFGIHKMRIHLQLNLVKIAELFLFFFLVILTSQSIFSGNFPFDYFVYPILVWGAFRFGRREITTGVLLIALIAVWYTVHGTGPFFLPHDVNRSLLRVAFYVSVTSFSLLAICAALLERKQARKGLEVSEKRFRSLIEKSFDAFVLIDAASRISYASPSVKQLLGYAPEELVGTVGFNLVAEEDRNFTMKELAKLVLKPGGVITIEYRTITKDKKVIWVEAVGTNLLLDPTVAAVVVNFRDITEKKLSRERIEKEKVEDEALLKSIGEGMIATDDTGKITLVNDAACEMLHMKKSDLIGKNIAETVPMQDGEGRTLPPEERPMAKVLEVGKTIVTSPHNYYMRPDKSKFPVRFTLTPIKLNNKIVGTIEIFRDITKEIEVDKAKSEFVSLASHQLRTPLTTINWHIERLMANELGKMPAKQKEYVQVIYHASLRMVALINALLNASRLELGTFIAEPTAVSYESVIDAVVADFKSDVQRRKIKLVKKIPAHLAKFSADPRLLTIIVQNLLSNAIKYSKDNTEIVIHVSSDEKGFVLEIMDHGVGIPKDAQKHIFSKMFRADNAKEIDRDGTGLGLYIVKSIADATGGSISFASVEKKGTTFTLRYPKTGMQRKAGTKELR